MSENKFLTEEEFQKLRDRGYSENDIVDLKAALNLVEISEMIPEDVNALLEKIENYFPQNDPAKTFEMMIELKDKDPEFLEQIFALHIFLGVDNSDISETFVGDALRQINEAEGENKQVLIRQLVERVKKLNPETKALFIEEVQLLSADEKKQLLNLLKTK